MPRECWARTCRAEIWDATGTEPTEKDPDGKPMPVDHDPGPPCTGTGPDCTHNPKGNLAVWRDEYGLLKWRYLRKRLRPCTCDGGTVNPYCDEHGAHGGPIKPGEHRAISHWATCKDRARFRKKARTS